MHICNSFKFVVKSVRVLSSLPSSHQVGKGNFDVSFINKLFVMQIHFSDSIKPSLCKSTGYSVAMTVSNSSMDVESN